MSDSPMLLHVYAQVTWHDPLRIHGTRDALSAFHTTLGSLLASGAQWPYTFFTNDGEGFAVEIHVESEASMDYAPVPYTGEEAREQ